MFSAIVKCLEIIKNNVGGQWNCSSVRDTSELFHGTLEFQFIVCLIVVSGCLEIARPLTKQFQSVNFDVVASKKSIYLMPRCADCKLKLMKVIVNGLMRLLSSPNL